MRAKGGEGEDTLEQHLAGPHCTPSLLPDPLSTQTGRAGQRQADSHMSGRGNHSKIKGAQSMRRTRALNGSAYPVDLIVYEDQKPSLWAKLPDLYKALLLPTLMETDLRPKASF